MRVGTPLYTSPEQEKGGSYDNKTDIYSLGLIFCEMLCVFGTTHERYQTLTRLREKHELPENIFNRFPRYSEGLKTLVLKMTRKAPSDRPSAEDLLKEVDCLSEGRDSPVRWMQGKLLCIWFLDYFKYTKSLNSNIITNKLYVLNFLYHRKSFFFFTKRPLSAEILSLWISKPLFLFCVKAKFLIWSKNISSILKPSCN